MWFVNYVQESFELTSMSSDAARKHAKLEHLATQDLTSNVSSDAKT